MSILKNKNYRLKIMNQMSILKTKNYRLKTNKGFSLLELILAIALFAIFSLGITTVVTRGMESNRLASEIVVANEYSSQAIDAVRSIRNQAYTNLINSVSTGLAQISSLWAFSGTNNTLQSNKYTRVVKVESVNRSGGNIVASGGTLDTDTKKITATTSWNAGPTRADSVSFVTYLTNWHTTIPASPPPPPLPDWTNSTLSSTFDLTNANSGDNDHDGISIAYANNKVYLGRANSAGSEFYIFDVSAPDSPVLLNRRDLNGNPNDILINGNYAYIASSDDNSELQILDISNSADITSAGKLTTFDMTNANSGNNNADPLKLAISGNYLYMLRNVGGGRDFYVFNITNATAPSIIGNTSNTVAVVSDMVVSGNYAYIVSTGNSDELEVIDCTTKTAPTRLTSLNLNSGNNNADGLSIALVGSYVLVGRAASSAPELYAVNISTPGSPTLASTMEVGFDVTDIAVDSLNKLIFLSTSDASGEIKIASYTSLASLPSTFIKTFNLGGLINDMAYSMSIDRLFMASAYNSGEFMIIKPQ